MSKSLLLTLLALIVLITGFGKAVSAVKETKEAKARIESKQKRVAQLHELAASGPITPATLRPDDLERTALDTPAPFRKLVSVYLEDHVTSVKDQPTKPLSPEHPGWQVQRAELSVTDVPWTALARFLHKTGSQPHPWRLAKYNLTPNENGGSGTLVFETVARKR